MKEKFQKSMEHMNNAMGQVAEKSKQVAVGTKENMQNLAVKIQDENIKVLLKNIRPNFRPRRTILVRRRRIPATNIQLCGG